MTAERNTRTERDSMGTMEVPVDALYGASTMRAVLNFPISDLRFSRTFIRALGLIKLAAARSNMELELLEPDLAQAIVQAAQEVAGGGLDDHFVVDIFQTGSGTSTNTNANESHRQPGHTDSGTARQEGPPQRPCEHGPVLQRRDTHLHPPVRPHGNTGRADSLVARPAVFPAPQVGSVLACHQERPAPTCRMPRPSGWARCSVATRGRWSAACAAWSSPSRSWGKWP